jgi:hypothetical protein
MSTGTTRPCQRLPDIPIDAATVRPATIVAVFEAENVHLDFEHRDDRQIRATCVGPPGVAGVNRLRRRK